MMTLSAHFYKMCSQQTTICTPDPTLPIIPTPFALYSAFSFHCHHFPTNHINPQSHELSSSLWTVQFTIISNQPPTQTQTFPTDSSHNNLSSSSAAADSAHLFRQSESPHNNKMSTIIIITPIIINSNPLTSFIQQGPTANQLVVIVLQSIRHTPLRYCGR